MCADQKRRNCASQLSSSWNGPGFSRYRRRCASTVDSTKPASRSTRRCFDTVGCVIRSCRSIFPTDCSDVTSKPNMAQRFGSAIISNTDSMTLIYPQEHIPVKAYTKKILVGGDSELQIKAILVAESRQPLLAAFSPKLIKISIRG